MMLQVQVRGAAWAVALGVALGAVAAAGAGCRAAKEVVGIGTEVRSPAAGTPEAALQEVLRAAAMDDEEAGWAAFRPWVHPAQRPTEKSERDWREMAFARMRRQWRNYVVDQGTMAFVVMRTRTVGAEGVEVFIKSSKAEEPTPCTLEPTPTGRWGLTRCSL